MVAIREICALHDARRAHLGDGDAPHEPVGARATASPRSRAAADLDDPPHLAEVVQERSLDRNCWT